jgi:general secretion pathway protein M
MASTTAPPTQRLPQILLATFERLSARERTAVIAAGWIVGLGLLWWLALGPAIQTLRQAPAQHAQVDAQLASLKAMASTADAVRAQNTVQPLSRADSLQALEATMSSLSGTALLSVVGDRPTVTLRETPPEVLALWLAQVRLNARLTPVEAQLTANATPVRWSGSLVLGGPSLSGGN